MHHLDRIHCKEVMIIILTEFFHQLGPFLSRGVTNFNKFNRTIYDALSHQISLLDLNIWCVCVCKKSVQKSQCTGT